MRDHALHAHRVDLHAIDVGAAGTVELLLGGVRHGTQTGVAAGIGNALRRLQRSAGRRVEFVRVVQLNDLGRIEEPGRLSSERHGQHRGNCKVGRNEHAHLRVVGAPGADLLIPGIIETGRAHHAVDAVIDAVFKVVHHGRWRGEVHDDLRAALGKDLERVAAADLCNQLQVLGLVHAGHHSGTHAPLRSEHSDLDHLVRHAGLLVSACIVPSQL